ncbi:hypothetical protein V2J09_019708 [Rumex salicifolius]
MSVKKLLSTSKVHLRPIPAIVLNSINCAQLSATRSLPTFTPKSPSVLATNLIKSYFERGSIKEARVLFDEMPERDVVAWTAMIAGYASCDHHSRAWMVFCEMLRGGAEPNSFTISSVLKVCKGLRSYSYGALVHAMAVKLGLIGSIYVDNSLLDVYATCCVSMNAACLVFQEIDEKNEVSWTTMITGYTHRGDAHNALELFCRMLSEGSECSAYSFSIAVRACSVKGSCIYGKQIHGAIIKHGLEPNLAVMNSLLDMYCRCNSLHEAQYCFNEMTEKNLITWNTLIAGYERSNSSLCLSMFSRMEKEGLNPNCFTFTSIVAVCANIALLNCGQQVHGAIFRRGFDQNPPLANALIDMYAKCGDIMDSTKVFDEMSSRDILSWTSMMIGYGTHGYGKEAVELFDMMIKSGITPDRIVFMAIFCACSHTGLVDEGLKHFEMMIGKYNISPDQEVYGCVVDLLGKAGRVEEAYKLIKSMPFEPDESVWGAFLGSCRAHKVDKYSKLATQRILKLRSNKPGMYVTLSHLYAVDGKWMDYVKMRDKMKKLRKKEAGRSWLELRNHL